MAHGLRIEALDRSGRWYLTPGSRSIYDLRVRNDAKDAADCSIVIEDPASGVTVDPPTFTLRGHEVRTVTVLFSENANATRAQRVLMKLCDDSGAELATFEHPLVVAGGTDCSLSLSFKNVILEAGELQGFALQCTVRSQSEAPCSLPLTVTSHPSLSIPEIPEVHLEPGTGVDVVIPMRWDQTKKDGNSQNHPSLIEISVPVSNGRRTTRMRWDLIAERLESARKQAQRGAEKAAPAAAATPSPTAAPPAQKSLECAPPAPAVTPDAKHSPPQPQPPQPRPAATPKTPHPKPETPAPKPALVVAEKSVTPLLMLGGQSALKCLPNPAPSNGAVRNGVVAAPKVETPAAPQPAPKIEAVPAAPGDVIELPLFADLGTQNKTSEPTAKTEPVAPASTKPANALPANVTPASVAAAEAKPVSAKPPSTAAPETPRARTGEPASAVAKPKKADVPDTQVSSPSNPWTAVVTPAAALAAQPAAPAAAATLTPGPGASAKPQAVASSAAAPATPAQSAPPKLTPYASVRPDTDAAMAASLVVEPKKEKATAPPVNENAPAAATADVQIDPPARTTATLTRARPIAPAKPARHGIPAGVAIGAAAVAAVAVAVVFFKPNASPPPAPKAPLSQSVAAAPAVPQARVQVHELLPVRHSVIPAVKAKVATATPAVAKASSAPTAAPTARPSTPKPTAQNPASQAPARHQAPAFAAPVPKPQPVQQLSQSVVALGEVEAYYGARGHVVRVLWSAADQAWANVQLIDDRGTTVSSTYVRGARQSAILYLPRRFRGNLTVQVSSVGRGGERVATTTSLPEFGN